MQFLYPNFLYALILVSLPVIIHLFNFRRHKTVYYSNIQFLKQVKDQNKSVRQLKDWLSLLFRVLAVAALVLAFSGPYIPPEGDNNKLSDATVIYLDNSFSMQAEGESGKLIETAKSRAETLIESYPENHPFLFITNDFLPKHRHLVSKEQAADFIYETRLTGAVRKLSAVMQQIYSFAEENPDLVNYDLFLISDFQKTTADIDQLPDENRMDISLIPLNAQIQNNLLIDSVWFDTPYRAAGRPEKLNVSITNTSDKDYLDIPLRLFLDDSLKVPASFNINGRENHTARLEYTNTKTGALSAMVEIDDYPVTFDNRYYFSVNIKPERNMLLIGETRANKYIASVFADNDYFNIQQALPEQLKISEISSFDVVVLNSPGRISSGLNRYLINFVSEGGTLIVFSGIEVAADDYNELLQGLNAGQITGTDTLSLEIKTLAYQSELYQNVFDEKQKNPSLPIIKNKLLWEPDIQSAAEILWADERNQAVLSKNFYGKGQCYFFAAAAHPDAGDMIFHPLWVPTVYNMVLLQPRNNNYDFFVGEPVNIIVENADYSVDDPVFLASPESENMYVMERRPARQANYFSLPPVIRDAGSYNLTQNKQKLLSISFNYKRDESRLECYPLKELEDFIKGKNLSNVAVNTRENQQLVFSLSQKKQGKSLVSYFVVAALLFLLGEIISLRIIAKHV